MEFTRSHGTGNDFVVLVDLDDRLELSEVLVRALTDRRRGVGGDGVIRIGGSIDGGDVFMDYRNADGSIVEMCGNGVRVVAKHVVDHALVAASDDTVVVGTRAGNKPVRVVSRHDDGTVHELAVDMGEPDFSPAHVPFDPAGDDQALVHGVEVPGSGSVELSVVSMGNPHGVLIVHDVAQAPVSTLGPRLETHERFPAKANISFAEVLADDRIRLRVWERGVGETAACGTAACASVVSLHRRGFVGEKVDVELPGGRLGVVYAPGGVVVMTGAAVEIASGVLDDRWLDAARRGEMEAGTH